MKQWNVVTRNYLLYALDNYGTLDGRCEGDGGGIEEPWWSRGGNGQASYDSDGEGEGDGMMGFDGDGEGDGREGELIVREAK